MKKLLSLALLATSALAARHPQVDFQTSDRCVACHNQLTTSSGQDVSIGLDWSASIMANSSRDPYWQASVRRETIDHGSAQPEIEDECSVCHMPVTRYRAKLKGELGEIFSHLPFQADKKQGREAEDGVTCTVCHQIGREKLGTRESFNGGFVIDAPPGTDEHREYGPFHIEDGLKLVMRSSTGGFVQQQDDHIRDSKLCATCHTLYTEARGEGGKIVGALPEQMPYLEWLASDYRDKQSCQECHMPEVKEPVPIAHVLGIPRQGLHQHVFVGGDFFLQGMLNRYRDELSVSAMPQQLSAARENTISFLKQKTARLKIESASVENGQLTADVSVENLTGHKFPTAFPSRRAWLHVLVRDANGRVLFESGALHPDGSIAGNDNDADASRYEPHYREITGSDQVEIYEDILGDAGGRVTTGLLAGTHYLKDNRLLPHGFNKQCVDKDIAVEGEAATDDSFNGAGSRVRYRIDLHGASGPFRITAELWYQPIGYRWANNLKAYKTAETQRFNGFYDSMSAETAVLITTAEVTR
ncbi:MAG TPA: hypothetical protein VKX25_07720 [Bryobacteraceae bacterium]|nr:hypothetical protein [Bryobacteraceae bacterium]